MQTIIDNDGGRDFRYIKKSRVRKADSESEKRK